MANYDEASPPDDDYYDENSLFDIGLNPTGDDGSSFRTENDPNALYQRANFMERKGAIAIRCTCLDVVHGLLTSGNVREFATLIVLRFNTDVHKRARRVASANIVLEFASMEVGKEGPEVLGISPLGSMVMVQTQAHQEIKKSAGVKLEAPPLAGIGAGGELGWDKTVSMELTDATKVIGSIDLRGRNYGPPNCASWTLLENEMTNTGIPAVMRMAILLKRRNQAKFQCTFEINATVDYKSNLERLFGTKPKDDPVFFDPDMEPTNKLQTYDIYNLGSVDLGHVSDITFNTVVDGAIKHV
ncbi:hypothetical protein SLS58_007098 [Diplodia intermedia]|uniref:Uncharacterized protein n=1 Tax=Diplodia intermedia TaxID=856260 RepID=A0ABR3TL20_9PEZI